MLEKLELGKWYELRFDTFWFYFRWTAGNNYVQMHWQNWDLDLSCHKRLQQAIDIYTFYEVIQEYKKEFFCFNEIFENELTAWLETERIEQEMREMRE